MIEVPPRRIPGRPPAREKNKWQQSNFHEPTDARCGRCDLMGHTTENCDLRNIYQWASLRPGAE